MQLTTSHITTLLTLGVLFSAGLAVATDGLLARWPWLSERRSWAKKWLPIWAGTCLGAPLFPAAFSSVVEPVVALPLVVDWWLFVRVALWLIFGAFAGLVGGIGAWFAHDFAKAIISKAAG